jgi:uncharacterized membrane protein
MPAATTAISQSKAAGTLFVVVVVVAAAVADTYVCNTLQHHFYGNFPPQITPFEEF